MNFKKINHFIFLTLGAGLFFLKLWVSEMSWTEIGIAALVSLFLGLSIRYFRKPLVDAINETCVLLEDTHSLMYTAVMAMTVMYCVFLRDSSSINVFLICASCLVHGLNLHSHQQYPQGAISCLFLGLTFQILCALLQTTFVATVAVLGINLAALLLLPKQYANQRTVEHNKTYILLTYLILSSLLLFHTYSLDDLSDVGLHIVAHDSLGWGIQLYRNYPPSVFMLVSVLICWFILFGTYLIHNRPSAVFVLILLGSLLFMPWNIATAVLFWTVTSYIPLDKVYISLEDLIDMEEVPEALERKVLNNFADNVKKASDLDLLQDYIFDHPTLLAWHFYLHLARIYLDKDAYRHAVVIAETSLNTDEFDILFPPLEFVIPE